MKEPIRVLHVDDEPGFVDTSAAFLERKEERINVDTATSADEGLGMLEEHGYDCVVSDYDMPGTDGIELLRRVRQDYPDLPFILFTGKGSEEVASEAISADVTHYLRKRPGTEQYELLAHRILKATERHRVKKEVDWHKRIIQNMGEGVYVFDSEYVFQFVNYRRRIEELSEDDWVGRSLSVLTETGLLTPEEVEDIKRGADRILAGETDEVRVEIEPSLPEETGVAELRLTALQVGTDDLVLGLTRDITELKHRGRELRRYETFIQNSPDVITHLDTDGTMLYQSPGTEKAFGHGPGIDVGENVFEYVHPDDRERVSEKFTDTLEDPETDTESVELRLEDTEGGYVWTEATAIDQTDTELGGAVVRLRDISERKERERDLKRQNERLDEFASVVSHDLRNPLAVAEGRVELAREDCDSEHLEQASDALDRMGRLIEDILTLAREGVSVRDIKAVELPEVVEGSWRNVGTEDATLLNKTESTVRADRSRLRQLLENLVRNSVEHGTASGQPGDGDTDEYAGVTVTVGETDDGFYVADDGEGIPADDRDRIFERGYTTSEEGTGLGLSIVRGVAKAHGWDVEAKESEEGGACFEVTGVERAEE
jgi:PAS domain S-box-containing protein